LNELLQNKIHSYFLPDDPQPYIILISLAACIFVLLIDTTEGNQ